MCVSIVAKVDTLTLIKAFAYNASLVPKNKQTSDAQRIGLENGIENGMPLYKSVFCCHLEYGVQFWLPHLRKDSVK